MATMIDGIYRAEDTVARTDPDGAWRRGRSVVRNWITPDGSVGPTGEGGFPAEAGRYHLYVAWNCPWAHRTLLDAMALQQPQLRLGPQLHHCPASPG